MSVKAHLVDGTYELFRMFFGAPPRQARDGREVGAACAVVRSLFMIVNEARKEKRSAYVGIAFDHVIESFRNDLFDGYKTGAGIDPVLFDQFGLVEELCRAAGFRVWPMIEFEADDAIATAAHELATNDEVDQILLCSPDKDLAQSVRGERVVLVDRRRKQTYDETGVKKKFGVPPSLIADWLGLVGDDADGIPGVPKWGAKSAAAVLCHFGGLEQIPADPADWDLEIRGRQALIDSLNLRRTEAALYKKLATLRVDARIPCGIADLEWTGADMKVLEPLCVEIGDPGLLRRVPKSS